MGGLDDQIHVHVSSGEAFEQLGRHTGLIRHMGEGQHSLMLYQFGTINGSAQLKAVAADRTCAATGERGARFIAPAGANHHGDPVVAGDLHRSGVQHGRTEAGQLQHFVAAHL